MGNCSLFLDVYFFFFDACECWCVHSIKFVEYFPLTNFMNNKFVETKIESNSWISWKFTLKVEWPIQHPRMQLYKKLKKYLKEKNIVILIWIWNEKIIFRSFGKEIISFSSSHLPFSFRTLFRFISYGNLPFFAIFNMSNYICCFLRTYIFEMRYDP